MVSVHSIEVDGDITHIKFNLTKEEISVLIFAGMTETTYDHSLIFPFPKKTEESMFDVQDLKMASMDNNVSEEDGYLFLQIGIQTAIVSGINAMSKQITDESCKEDACGITNDNLAPIDQV